MTRPIPALSSGIRYRRYLIPALLLTLGCATPYRAAGFQGDFTEERVGEDTFWVRFEGNVPVDAKTLEQSLLRRAAELTLEQGFAHFVVVNQSRQTGLGFVLRPGLIGPSRRTERAILIRCSGPLGEPGAIDADAFLKAHDAPSGPTTL